MTIVKDDQLAGDPRIEGRRVTVYHVVTAVRDFGGLEEAAEELRIPLNEVKEALEYAENHRREIAEIEREYGDLRNQ